MRQLYKPRQSAPRLIDSVEPVRDEKTICEEHASWAYTAACNKNRQHVSDRSTKGQKSGLASAHNLANRDFSILRLTTSIEITVWLLVGLAVRTWVLITAARRR